MPLYLLIFILTPTQDYSTGQKDRINDTDLFAYVSSQAIKLLKLSSPIQLKPGSHMPPISATTIVCGYS